MYIIAAIIFLLIIQIRSLIVFKDPENKRHRYKYDTLDYYDIDIDWFACSFTMLIGEIIHLFKHMKKFPHITEMF